MSREPNVSEVSCRLESLPSLHGCWLRARLLIGCFAQICLVEKTYLKLSLGDLKFKNGLDEHELG